MKAIMLMFDTLSREYLPNYGNDWVIAPNFRRLEEHFTRFDQFYAGSLPCMPARRELHTGKYNFLHRKWGPLEAFDESAVEMLKKHGVYTHLITDHWHYFEDGGATYHNRYQTWDCVRGGEGDPWQIQMKEHQPISNHTLNNAGKMAEIYAYNREALKQESDYPTVKVMERGLDFIERFADQDNWFLQIECFDPHEPFDSPDCYRKLYGLTKEDRFNWPKYQQVDTKERWKDDVGKLEKEYAALITMCDTWLGKFLDRMDELDLWKDTMVIVNTDHGFMLGQHGWLGKNEGPQYEEIAHIPFFIHVPGQEKLEVCDRLSQTVDIPPSLLTYFKAGELHDPDGVSFLDKESGKIRQEQDHDAILYGICGGHVNMVKDRCVYMKASNNPANEPFENYSLAMVTGNNFLSAEVLHRLELDPGNRYSNHLPVLKYPLYNRHDSYSMGDMLFDLAKDPKQKNPLHDSALEQKMSGEMIALLKEKHAPESLLERLFGKDC